MTITDSPADGEAPTPALDLDSALQCALPRDLRRVVSGGCGLSAGGPNGIVGVPQLPGGLVEAPTDDELLESVFAKARLRTATTGGRIEFKDGNDVIACST